MGMTMVCGIMRDLDAEMLREMEKSEALRRCVSSAKAWDIARICARYELESDEFYTREQKAAQYITPAPAC